MSDPTAYLDRLLELVRFAYPAWQDFTHSAFVEDELNYQHDAATYAQVQLSRAELQRLLDAADYSGIVNRLKAVAYKTNLLYMGTPQKGDLAIIHQREADLGAICRAIFELLHGVGPSEQRLDAFIRFVGDSGLPQRWTFPTYYLFLLYPDQEVFIKPDATRWFLSFIGQPETWSSNPNSATYSTIRKLFLDLWEATRPYAAADLIDVRCLVWVAYSVSGVAQAFDAAVGQLQEALAQLDNDRPSRHIVESRDEVINRFGRLLSPDHLPSLTKEEFAAFLDFKNNNHWSAIDQNIPLVTADMAALRNALLQLHDEERPLAERYDAAREVSGLGKARITSILLVTHPQSYGVWNKPSEEGLRQLKIWPKLGSKTTEGELYEAVNDTLLYLADALGIDLWTLDILWDMLRRNGASITTGLVKDLLPKDANSRAERTETTDAVINNHNGIAHSFRGFTTDAFAFLSDLRANNTTSWMSDNEPRWQQSVREPMRALFTDLGPPLKELLDPYLAPDGLATEAKFGSTLATIKKRWPDTDGPYYHYFWGAFYRESLTKQTDAQLFVVIEPEALRYGFYVGERASKLRDRFRQRVLADPDNFYGLVKSLGLDTDFEFAREHSLRDLTVVPLHSPEDLGIWLESGGFDLLQRLSPEQTTAAGPALADRIYDAFRRVFPIYLWAVADDPLLLVERYLAAEFPIEEEGAGEVEPPPAPFTRERFLRGTSLPEGYGDELYEILQEKQQVIFYGPPGTGKTYIAHHLARWLTGLDAPPPQRVTTVQFHPAFGYEDFIEGIRPKRGDDGQISYEIHEGVFKRFCREAMLEGNAPCVFIIDEINRGNIPRIFGELMYLMEYRDKFVHLPYSGKPFSIPQNVYIIGTMNTADRSIALVDFALRRRFQFFRFRADPELFERWLEKNPSPHLPYLARLYHALAMEAVSDDNFRIGPSYFMPPKPIPDERALERIWRLNIEPALEEYHLEQPDKVDPWRWDGERVRAIRQGYDE